MRVRKVRITTVYIGPVGFAGSKIRAKGGGRQVTIPYPLEERQGVDAHAVAARALAERLGFGTVEAVDEDLGPSRYVFEAGA